MIVFFKRLYNKIMNWFRGMKSGSDSPGRTCDDSFRSGNDYLDTIKESDYKADRNDLAEAKLKVSYATNTGNTRSENQDNYYIDSVGRKLHSDTTGTKVFDMSERRIFAVFDGMGGEAFGSEASEIAASCLINNAKAIKRASGEELYDYVSRFVTEANDEICDMTLERRCGISGSTMSLVCIDENSIYGYSLGDSKIYVYDGNVITQVNDDQTVAAQKVKAGIYTEEEARKSSDNSKLTMFLGVDMVRKGLRPLKYEPIELKNKVIILCSDGVSNACSYEEMIDIIRSGDGNKAEKIIKLAMQNHSSDNVTCVLIENI